jgi:hypothetical protein
LEVGEKVAALDAVGAEEFFEVVGAEEFPLMGMDEWVGADVVGK